MNRDKLLKKILQDKNVETQKARREILKIMILEEILDLLRKIHKKISPDDKPLDSTKIHEPTIASDVYEHDISSLFEDLILEDDIVPELVL